ncbi:hypothetical protein EYZ11_006522 [Aspergillus tanneri]|uniref:Endonuclease/exonuclease/phosphatase domain-containing protein n=1 Tax=Aspergillus tanneri TaxID=1220188 RepID=A0A4S3JFB8_9EURO|nr:hypothetical protein EYZ11_006522 [Aspergillus tanneri]
MTQQKAQLKVLQANCGKRVAVMQHLFGEKEVQNTADIIAVQELHTNNTKTPPPRVAFFIKLADKLVHVYNVYNPGPQSRGDENGEENSLTEDINHPGLSRTLDCLRAEIHAREEDEHLILGDFNLHHPMWAATGYNHQDPEAEQLIDLVTDHQLELLLPEDTVTYEQGDHQTTIDLV